MTSFSPTPVTSEPMPKRWENSSSSNTPSNEKDGLAVTIPLPGRLSHMGKQNNGLEITPEIKCETESIADRKRTPWIRKIPMESKDQGKLQEENCISLNENDHEALENPNDVNNDDHDDQEAENYNDDSVSKRTRPLDHYSSEPGSLTQFGNKEIPKYVKSSPRDSEKLSPFLANFIYRHENDNDYDEKKLFQEGDSDPLGSWNSSIDAIILDDPDILAEFGPQYQWRTPSRIGTSIDTVNHQTIARFEENIADQENNDCLILDEFHPYQSAKNNNSAILKQIQEANERWSSFNDSIQNCKQTPESSDTVESTNEEERKPRVTFMECLVTHVTFIMPRIRKADLSRSERLLKPIFDTEHRQKMRLYIKLHSTSRALQIQT